MMFAFMRRSNFTSVYMYVIVKERKEIREWRGAEWFLFPFGKRKNRVESNIMKRKYIFIH